MVSQAASPLTLFLCGDVMTGRGIDQALPHPVEPTLHERYVKDARHYVELAERARGPISRPLQYAAIWGDALAELARFDSALRLINLETSVTTTDEPWPGKGVHYRMHPDNVPCLTAAGIGCCTLANNHVLDWGIPGLLETLDTLADAGLATAGAGRDVSEARSPAIFPVPAGTQIVVFGLGRPSSGIPQAWTAEETIPGVNLLVRASDEAIAAFARQTEPYRRPGSIIVASIHWGPNWGYDVPPARQDLAHRLIDDAGVDVVHGHSAHHVLGIEVYHERLILYGCGDLLTDYEGIGGREAFRGDLGLMYFPELDPASGHLLSLTMTPTQMRRFQVKRARPQDGEWLQKTLNREGGRFNTRVRRDDDGRLHLIWR
ncbi:MAG: CapA family protein [Candidatus Promineifilaceae bacterium]|nr:CapA family protein [Candidatus Promineifilaceae bacterium]